MFGVKDLESLNNLGTFLTVPLVAAGYITAKKTTFELENPVEALLQAAPDVFFFGLAYAVIIALIIASSSLPRVLSVPSFILFFLVAFTCLTIGLCKIPIFVMSVMQGGVPAHDIFWTLGYISGGFTIIEVAGSNFPS